MASRGMKKKALGPGGFVSHTVVQHPKPPWRKVLYDRQPYPDNYTDSSFLDSLEMNVSVSEANLWSIARESLAVSHQVSVVSTVAIAATCTLTGALQPQALLAVDAGVLVACVLILVCSRADLPAGWLKRSAFHCALCVAGIYVLSPILQTLTSSISSDTICASTAWLLLFHLFTYDYSGTASASGTVSGSFSLHCGICATVLLASRLQDPLPVFALVLFAIEVFALLPIVQHYLRTASLAAHQTLSLVTILVNAVLAGLFSPVLLCVLGVVLLFISVLSPWWLTHLQRYKHEICGPWDEARVAPVPDY